MSNERIGFYEGMFLFPQEVTADLQGAVDHIKGILDKADATIKTFSKWDERRLAYEIDGNKRGVYFLAYFDAPATSLSEIERMCNQSEKVLRMLITKADHVPTEIIEANDGLEKLATEIKLRGEKSSEATAASSSKITKKETPKANVDASKVTTEDESTAEEVIETESEKDAPDADQDTPKETETANEDKKDESQSEDSREEIEKESTET